MSKHVGAAKKKRDERHEKHKSEIHAAVAGVMGKVDKFSREVAEKHNGIAKQVQELTQQVAQDLGQLSAYIQTLSDSSDRMDLNVLALADLTKKLSIDLYVMKHSTPDKAPEELAKEAETFYRKLMAESFDTVIKKREEGAKARREALQKAEEDRKAAEAARSEAEKAEEVLLAAERGMIADATNSGGQGSPIPEGAEVFGG